MEGSVSQNLMCVGFCNAELSAHIALYASFWLACLLLGFSFEIAQMLKVGFCGIPDRTNSSSSNKVRLCLFRHTQSPQRRKGTL